MSIRVAAPRFDCKEHRKTEGTSVFGSVSLIHYSTQHKYIHRTEKNMFADEAAEHQYDGMGAVFYIIVPIIRLHFCLKTLLIYYGV